MAFLVNSVNERHKWQCMTAFYTRNDFFWLLLLTNEMAEWHFCGLFLLTSGICSCLVNSVNERNGCFKCAEWHVWLIPLTNDVYGNTRPPSTCGMISLLNSVNDEMAEWHFWFIPLTNGISYCLVVNSANERNGWWCMVDFNVRNGMSG